MNLRLFELEFYTEDPSAAKRFYSDQLGLRTDVDEDGVKVFDSGVGNLAFIKSNHFPGKVSISFYSIPKCVTALEAAGVEILERDGDPVCAIVLRDTDDCRVEIKNQYG